MPARPRVMSPAEATARRLAMSANRKQPLSVRNRTKQEKQQESPSLFRKMYSEKDEKDLPSRPAIAGKVPVRDYERPTLERFDSFGSNSESIYSETSDFGEVAFDDPFTRVDKSDPAVLRTFPARDQRCSTNIERGLVDPTRRGPTNTSLATQSDHGLRKFVVSDPVHTAHPKRSSRETRDGFDAQFQSASKATPARGGSSHGPSQPSSLDNFMPSSRKAAKGHGSRSKSEASTQHDRSVCSRRTSVSLDTALKKKPPAMKSEWNKSWGSEIGTMGLKF
jgi:hypothetical protein